MEGLVGLFVLFIGIIQIAMIIKFFEMAGNISRISKSINEFTKYYYALQDYKNKKRTDEK